METPISELVDEIYDFFTAVRELSCNPPGMFGLKKLPILPDLSDEAKFYVHAFLSDHPEVDKLREMIEKHRANSVAPVYYPGDKRC